MSQTYHDPPYGAPWGPLDDREPNDPMPVPGRDDEERATLTVEYEANAGRLKYGRRCHGECGDAPCKVQCQADLWP